MTDKYVDSNITGNVVNKLLTSLAAGTGNLYVAAQTFEIAAADNDGDVFRVFKNLDPNLIPLAFLISNDAITGGTVYDLGLYKPDLGAVINDAVFLSAGDLSTEHKLGPAAALSGMTAVDVADVGKRLFEHAGHTITTKLEGYDLAFTADTVGTAAGTITLVGIFAQG